MTHILKHLQLQSVQEPIVPLLTYRADRCGVDLAVVFDLPQHEPYTLYVGIRVIWVTRRALADHVIYDLRG